MDHSFEETFNRILNTYTPQQLLDICDEADTETELLFAGQDDLPENELAIVLDESLSFDQKMAKLQVIRAGKTIRPKSFRKRISRADAIHARGLGISLD